MNKLKLILIVLVVLLFLFLAIFFYANKENIKKYIHSFHQDEITIDVIKSKKNTEVLWVYYKGSVYNITSFVNINPKYENMWNYNGENLSIPFKYMSKQDVIYIENRLHNYKIGIISL